MTSSPSPSAPAIEPSLEWAIRKYGADFFTVRWLWTRSDTVFKWEKRSTLEKLGGYQNAYGGLTNWGLVAAMRNMAKTIRGEDKEQVKIHAFKLVARMIPAKRRMVLSVRSMAMVMTEQGVPTVAEHQEVEIPVYGIDFTSFEEAVCEKEMLRELRRMDLSLPVSVEYDTSYHFLAKPQ